MEKRNIVEAKWTPAPELEKDAERDELEKEAVAMFGAPPIRKPVTDKEE